MTTKSENPSTQFDVCAKIREKTMERNHWKFKINLSGRMKKFKIEKDEREEGTPRKQWIGQCRLAYQLLVIGR